MINVKKIKRKISFIIYIAKKPKNSLTTSKWGENCIKVSKNWRFVKQNT